MAAKSKIGKAFEAASGKNSDDTGLEEDVSTDAESEPDAEVLAMKQFLKASSPEDKAAALKDFLRACGAIGYEEEDPMSGMSGMESPMPDLGF